MRPVLLLLALCVPAEDPAPTAAPVVLRAARMFDAEAGRIVPNPRILVRGGRIAEVATEGSDLEAPAGSRTIDLGDRTLLPGFIDCHVHLCGRTVGEGDNWEDARVRDLPQEDAIRGVRNAALTLRAGFTTVRMVGARAFSDIALRNMIEQGVVPGPRILTAAHSLGITGGHCDTNGYAPGVVERDPKCGIADGPDEIRKAVRTQIKRGADVIKFCATGGVLSEGDEVGAQQYTLEEMRVLVETAHLLGRKVAAHAHGTEGIKTALRAGVDSIEHGSLLDEEAIQLFAETGAYLVPTLMAQEAVERQAKEGVLTGLRREKALWIAPRARASFRKAAQAGVRIALGSDAGVFAHGTQGREFVLMVENGLSAARALQAGTIEAARLLGLEGEIGSIVAGKVADLVAVDGDPIADIETVTRPVFVMHEGRVIVGPGGG